MEEKLRQYFEDMVVYKDLQESNFFSSLKLPSFLRDWLLKMFEDEDGKFDIAEITDFIHTYIPSKTDWVAIKNRIVKDNEKVKILTRISVDIDIQTQDVSFSLPDFGLLNKETIIEDRVWDECKDELVKAKETWGVVELGYRYPEPTMKIKGKIKLLSFQNFCPYDTDLDFFKDARREFDIHEWIDIVLGAIDYNAAGYENEQQKLAMLKRLLPFVEKRLNLIELAPKGTGKSYVFGNLSKYGWLVSGGKVTRAKLFYDKQRQQNGIIKNHDFTAFDEIQTIVFQEPSEIQAALKSYLESGKTTIDNTEFSSECGLILMGNIPLSKDRRPLSERYFDSLPENFKESALLDRFHCFIEGWYLPRINKSMIFKGWTVNVEYFSEILHAMRTQNQYSRRLCPRNRQRKNDPSPDLIVNQEYEKWEDSVKRKDQSKEPPYPNHMDIRIRQEAKKERQIRKGLDKRFL